MSHRGPAVLQPCQRAKLARGTDDKGARHVRETQQQNRRDRHRYRQEFVSYRRPRSAWSPGAAPEVVTWPSGSAACQPAAVSDWHGGLHRGASSQSQTSGAWPRGPLMPAKYVRPYCKGDKNDYRDAEAIAEAVQRPTMKFVATKTADQLDLQALHRVRERLVSQRTGIINQIRAFLLERGIAVRQGLRFL